MRQASLPPHFPFFLFLAIAILPSSLLASNRFVLSDTGDADVSRLIFSAQSPGGYEPWSIVWNFSDSLNYTRATLSFSNIEIGNDIYTPKWQIKVERLTDGLPKTITFHEGNTDISVSGRPNTMKLIVDPYSARLYAGEKNTAEICQVDFITDDPGCIGILVPDKFADRFSTSLMVIDKPSAEFPCEFEDTVRLKDYLALSTDANEGIWRYLDRDTDDSIALPDGKYTIATVKDNAGGYYILYLDGAMSGKNHWQPFQLKGHIDSTPFPDVYDLTWRDSNGIERSAEQNATISPDHSVLTLRFPLLSATIRFFKVVEK